MARYKVSEENLKELAEIYNSRGRQAVYEILNSHYLIRELIGNRLLELSKYVTIDSLSKRIIIDKTTLTTDGYQLITH